MKDEPNIGRKILIKVCKYLFERERERGLFLVMESTYKWYRLKFTGNKEGLGRYKWWVLLIYPGFSCSLHLVVFAWMVLKISSFFLYWHVLQQTFFLFFFVCCLPPFQNFKICFEIFWGKPTNVTKQVQLFPCYSNHFQFRWSPTEVVFNEGRLQERSSSEL